MKITREVYSSSHIFYISYRRYSNEYSFFDILYIFAYSFNVFNPFSLKSFIKS